MVLILWKCPEGKALTQLEVVCVRCTYKVMINPKLQFHALVDLGDWSYNGIPSKLCPTVTRRVAAAKVFSSRIHPQHASSLACIYIRGFTKFQITEACGLKFHWHLKTLSLKFQKATSKIEVFLSLEGPQIPQKLQTSRHLDTKSPKRKILNRLIYIHTAQTYRLS